MEKLFERESFRLEISNQEIMDLDSHDFKVLKMGDWYLTRILKKANEIGLSGRKIKEIVSVEENWLPNGRIYIDFICEGSKQI